MMTKEEEKIDKHAGKKQKKIDDRAKEGKRRN